MGSFNLSLRPIWFVVFIANVFHVPSAWSMVDSKAICISIHRYDHQTTRHGKAPGAFFSFPWWCWGKREALRTQHPSSFCLYFLPVWSLRDSSVWVGRSGEAPHAAQGGHLGSNPHLSRAEHCCHLSGVRCDSLWSKIIHHMLFDR